MTLIAKKYNAEGRVRILGSISKIVKTKKEKGLLRLSLYQKFPQLDFFVLN